MTESNIARRDIADEVAAATGVAPAAACGDIVGTARSKSTARTFVLVHGSWHGGWCWRRVSDLLEQKGHKVFSPTLTGLGERSHLLSKDINLDTHITDIVNVIKWEDLKDVCLVAHSYGGVPASGAIEQIGDRVSSIVWLDAFKPEDGQRLIDVITSPALRNTLLAVVEKGEAGRPAPNAEFLHVNEKDRAWVESKLTREPNGTALQPITLTGAREKVSRKTYIRASNQPNPAFDEALTECKADKSWRTFETTASGHDVMIDAPEWLVDILLQVS
jgi:pimeloyl-ACP methyl ester carboxylesterase